MSRLKQAAHFASFGGPARNKITMVGQTYGKLTTVSEGALGWCTFECECGNRITKQGHYIRNRLKKFEAWEAKTAPSCGCAR